MLPTPKPMDIPLLRALARRVIHQIYIDADVSVFKRKTALFRWRNT